MLLSHREPAIETKVNGPNNFCLLKMYLLSWLRESIRACALWNASLEALLFHIDFSGFIQHFYHISLFPFWLVFNNQAVRCIFHQATIFLTYCWCKTSHSSLSLTCTCYIQLLIFLFCQFCLVNFLPIVRYSETNIFIFLSYSHVNTLITFVNYKLLVPLASLPGEPFPGVRRHDKAVANCVVLTYSVCLTDKPKQQPVLFLFFTRFSSPLSTAVSLEVGSNMARVGLLFLSFSAGSN